jgi:O-antigen/teichoic acid export membrane protein
MLERIIPLFKQSILYSLGGLVGPLVSIFMVPIYTRIFMPDDYGVISLVQVTIAFVTVFLILGTDSASARYYLDPESDQDRKLTASTAMFFRIVILLAGCLVFICFSGEISRLIFQTSIHSKYLIIAAAAIPFVQCGALCMNLLRFNFRPVIYAALAVGNLLFSVLLTILFVVFLGWGIIGIFAATLISSIVLFLISAFITKGYFSLTFSTRRLRELLRFGIPLVPYGITVYLIQNCDRYFLSYFSTLEQVGLYSIGFQIANLLLLLFVGVSLAWSPFVLSTYKENNIKAIYARVMNYLVSATFLLVIGLSLFSREILMVFTTEQYLGAYIVVPFLALYMALYQLGLFMGFGIGIAKKTHHFTWIAGVTAAVNVGLNFLLVPRYGMIGAAIATLACSVVWCILLVSISQKYYHVNYSFFSFFKIALVSIAIIFAGHYFSLEVSWLNILLKIGLILIFLACLYFVNLIGKPELKYLKSLVYRVLLRR